MPKDKWPKEIRVCSKCGQAGAEMAEFCPGGRGHHHGGSQTVSVVPAQALTEVREALETVCKLYETACREEDPFDPESEYDENDPYSHIATFECFRRADSTCRTTLNRANEVLEGEDA